MQKYYTLIYRYGSNPHPMTLHFEFEGKLVEAIARGRKFCEVVGYKFHSVRPLIEDLNIIERRHLGVEMDYPSQNKVLSA